MAGVDGGWCDPDEIVEDLASGEVERLRRGLVNWLDFAKDGDELDVTAVQPWMLEVVSESPPAELVIDFARLLARYRSFVPQPSRSYVVRQLVELAVRYAVPQVIYETSIEIQIQADSGAAARDAVDYLRARGLCTPREIEAAQQLIGHLLEAKPPVRRAAAEALAGWSGTDVKAAIVAAVLPLADPAERSVLEAPTTPARLPAISCQDVAMDQVERYAIGIEQNSGRYYLAIPATNGMVDYSEYFEIGADMFERYRADLASALPFVRRCRGRQEDPRLLYQPSIRRGSST